MHNSKYPMANYFKRSKNVGRSNKPNEGYCKRHPKHRQSPGVCSLCLGEKLSQLSADSSSRSTITTVRSCSSSSSCSSVSSYYSSGSGSSCSSPMHRNSEWKGTSFSLLSFSGKNILTKSRSVAVATRLRPKDAHQKNKNGFLSKLLRPGSHNKRKEEASGFTHSRTMREIILTRY